MGGGCSLRQYRTIAVVNGPNELLGYFSVYTCFHSLSFSAPQKPSVGGSFSIPAAGSGPTSGMTRLSGRIPSCLWLIHSCRGTHVDINPDQTQKAPARQTVMVKKVRAAVERMARKSAAG